MTFDGRLPLLLKTTEAQTGGDSTTETEKFHTKHKGCFFAKHNAMTMGFFFYQQ